MKTLRPVGLGLALALPCLACGSSNSTTTTPSPVLVSETLTGTVNPPVNNVLQSASSPFTVASPGGPVSVTLTSAILTNPDGTTNSAVVMGLAVGTPSGATCALAAGNTPYLLQAGASSTISGNLAAGNFCVQVSDVTNQKGPVAYTVVVMHP